MEVTLDFSKVKAIVEDYAEKVDSLIDSYADKKEQIISLLQDIQAEFNYLPQDVLVKISQKLDIPLSQVFSVATFFRAFSLKAQGPPPGDRLPGHCLPRQGRPEAGGQGIKGLRHQARRNHRGHEVHPGNSQLPGLLRPRPRGRGRRQIREQGDPG